MVKQYRAIKLDEKTWALGLVTFNIRGEPESWEEVGIMAESLPKLRDELGRVLSGIGMPYLKFEELPDR